MLAVLALGAAGWWWYHSTRAAALPHLREVTRLDPADARPWRMMGLVRTNREEYEEAAEAYRESLKRDPHPPDEAEVRVELAVCLVKLRKEDEVLRELAGIETEA